MYRFSKRNTDLLAEAYNLAAMQLAHLQHQRADISAEEALPFIAREILQLRREGDNDVQRLANRAVSRFREHIQKKESALRVARPADPD